MESRARVEAALASDIADRPPVGAWGHSYLDEWSVDRLADVTINAQRRYRWDFVKLQPRATYFAEAFGARFRPSGDRLQSPVLVEPALRSSEDLSVIPKVDARARPLADQISSIAIVASQLGPAIPVIQTVFSPLTVAAHLVENDPQQMLHALHDRPKEVRGALARITDAVIDFSRASIEAGAAGIFFAITQLASLDTMPEHEYREVALPYDQRVLESLPAAAWFNVVHLCGSNLPFGLINEMPSHAVSWSIHDFGNPTLEEGIKEGGRAAMGGVAQKTSLVEGPREEVVEQVRAAASANDGRGVIVAPGCSIPPEAPDENLQLVAEAMEGLYD